MSVGIIFVASSPELYGFGSWPLNSDRRNCRFQLKNKIYENQRQNYMYRKFYFEESLPIYEIPLIDSIILLMSCAYC